MKEDTGRAAAVAGGGGAQAARSEEEEGSDDIATVCESSLTTQEPTAPYSAFSKSTRWFIVALVSMAAFFSPASANIWFPVIPTIASALSTSVEAINLATTYYMISQALSPTVWGAASDVLGRRPTYLATFTLYIGASFGLANTSTYPVLVVLRMLQSAGSASVIAIGSGTIGDIAHPKERGGFMGLFGLGSMLAPCISPVIGGGLADAFGWQSIFWFLAAFGGVQLLIMLALLPETLRSLVGNGSVPARGINRSLLSIWVVRQERKKATATADAADNAAKEGKRDKGKKEELPKRKGFREIDWLAPLKAFREPDVLLVLTYNSIGYALFYTVITSTAYSFERTYGLTPWQTGLCFISYGSGCIVATVVNGMLLNHDYRLVSRRLERKRAEGGAEGAADHARWLEKARKDGNDLSGFPIERARLRSMPYAVFGLVLPTIAYGWLVDKAVHLAAPLVFQFFIGLAATMQFNMTSTLLIDLFPGRGASAIAANNLSRCLVGAGGTAVVVPIIKALGEGWAFTLLSLITLCFAPLLVLEYKHGQRFRRKRGEKSQ